MAIQDYQNGEEKQHTPQDIAEPTQLVDQSRRSFTKTGLVASGVLLTLASRPVLGDGNYGGGGGWGGKGDKVGGWECKSPSGFLSGNLSFHGEPPKCQGRTPGYWCNTKDHSWPSSYQTGSCSNYEHSHDYASWSGGTRFHSCFNGSIYGNYSLLQVMLLGGEKDKYQLGAHCVAALLNASMVPSWTPVLTEQQVKNMFNEYVSSGSFQPTAGVYWDAEEIVTYLQSTMDKKTTY